MPTYGSYNLGALHPLSLTPGSWQIGDLLDRAQKRGKGQQEMLIIQRYTGSMLHAKYEAGGNDLPS